VLTSRDGLVAGGLLVEVATVWGLSDRGLTS